MSTIHVISPTEPPLLANFPYISCPLCIPLTLHRRSAWILILIESNMLETERLRKNALPQHSILFQLSHMLLIRLLLVTWEGTRA
jgi:hypothetical protein